jgi:hypothetical protein
LGRKGFAAQGAGGEMQEEEKARAEAQEKAVEKPAASAAEDLAQEREPGNAAGAQENARAHEEQRGLRAKGLPVDDDCGGVNKAGPSMASFALKIMGRFGAGKGRAAEGLRRGIDRFEREEKALRGGVKDAKSQEGPARFFHLLKRNENQDELSSGAARSRRRQVGAAVLCAALLFAAYFAWQKHFGPSEAELSFEDLQSRIPLKVDKYTTITRAEISGGAIELAVEKSDDAFKGMTAAQKEARLDEFGRRARLLCRNKLFRGMISGGRPLHVSLDSSGGGTLRKFTVESCPADPGA